MGVSFVSQKCSSCGGKLEHVKNKKIWRCLYCGGESERHEQYDGLFTIKNVVRQVIQDLSYRKIDVAAKNLVECEKIDSRYIGTIIAKLCYQMIAAITPGAVEPFEAKSLISQLKRSYEQLCEFGKKPTEEEELLYEFFEMDDNYATLILVYDALGADERRDYLVGLLNASQVYSVETNRNLIGYSLKHKQYDLLNKIVDNKSNIDAKHALLEILVKHEDAPEKTERVGKLMSIAKLEYDDKNHFDHYLSNQEDSYSTKASIAISAYEKGMKINLDIVLKKVICNLKEDEAVVLLRSMMGQRLSDAEVAKIVEFAYESKSTISILSALKETNQFVVVGSKQLIAISSRTDLNLEEKLKIIEKSFEFNMDQKSKEAIATHYLVYETFNPENRLILLNRLLPITGGIPFNSIETYVTKNAGDGSVKPAIVECLLSHTSNISYLFKLLSNYINLKIDEMETRHHIVQLLAEKGLKVEPAAFTDYICKSSDDIGAKINLIKMLKKLGSDFKRETMVIYLETNPPSQYSSELFAQIYTTSTTVSSKALTNYVVHCKEREGVKLENIRTLVSQCTSVSTCTTDIDHLGNKVQANIAQAYLLNTTDSYDLASNILKHLLDQRVKLNADMIVNGKNGEKFKKYVTAYKDKLSPLSLSLCESQKVFSLFF